VSQRRDPARAAALDGLREVVLAMVQYRLAAAARVDLHISDLSALSYLRSADAGIGQQQLAALISLNASSVTTMIDRLEAKGLAERTAHPGDRRKSVVVITSKGARLVDNVRARFAAAMDAVPDDDIASATSALRTIAHELAKQAHT
jgi:DNA-binding MarR family transcriptional regulator